MAAERIYPRLVAREARKAGDIDTLLRVLAGTDQGGRQSAVYELGELGAAEAVRPLVRCLQSPDIFIRVGALRALRKIGDEGAASEIHDLATSDDQFGVRIEAALTLAQLRDHRGVDLLTSLMWEENPYGSRYRGWAASRLRELGAVSAIPHLERVRWRAGVVGWWRVTRALRSLKKLREDEDASLT